tara:strand:+ start:199 stop:384 length:186 start_codon:yes stop_codon:yes gene_type:complete
MDYFEKMLELSNKKLLKMDINQLQKELDSYYCLLSTESFDNSIIMDKILFIQYLIKEKKDK